MSERAGGFDRANVQAIHPLSATQSSILLASLRARAPSADPGFLQLRCTLRGDLDERAFEDAWTRTLERHEALRASVHWRATEQPVQVVARRVQADWAVHDWSDADSATFDARLAAYLRADRERGLDLSRAPVMRLARMRRGPSEWVLAWTCHHVLLDGWSGSIVLRDVVRLHDRLKRGESAMSAPAAQFGGYLRWLRGRSDADAETWWRERLEGVAGATAFPAAGGRPQRVGSTVRDDVAFTLSAAASADVASLARAVRVTPGTVVHGAWAVVLGAHGVAGDVCFGTTVSGRSAPLDGIDEVVGTLIGALPVRASVRAGTTSREFLADLQRHLGALQRFEHTSPERIHDWSGLPGHRRVFDTLVVFENFPAGDDTLADTDALRIDDLGGGITSTMPITLVAAPGERLRLHLMYDPALVDADAARALLEDCAEVMSAFARDPDGVLPVLPRRALPEPGAATQGPTLADTLVRQPATADALESQLARIVEDVLAVRDVAIDDDFFALGGNSLNAARMFDRIARVFGRRLPLATLFEAPSVRALATRMRADGWKAPWSSLVALQSNGALAPLFCVHSYEGNILIYRDLAGRLGPDQPVYGLQSLGMDGGQPPLDSVEAMAAHYIAEIRTVQPAGPYRLAGICFGISVSFEMAQQLTAAGEVVDRLFILDSGFLQHLPVPTPPRGSLARRIARRIVAHSRGLRFRARTAMERAAETAHERNLRLVREGNIRAWTRYDPRWYDGTVTLIRSEGYGYHQDWHVQTWSKLAATLETHVVPGDHANLIYEPHVEHLAAYMRTSAADGVPA